MERLHAVPLPYICISKLLDQRTCTPACAIMCTTAHLCHGGVWDDVGLLQRSSHKGWAAQVVPHMDMRHWTHDLVGHELSKQRLNGAVRLQSSQQRTFRSSRRERHGHFVIMLLANYTGLACILLRIWIAKCACCMALGRQCEQHMPHMMTAWCCQFERVPMLFIASVCLTLYRRGCRLSQLCPEFVHAE